MNIRKIEDRFSAELSRRLEGVGFNNRQNGFLSRRYHDAEAHIRCAGRQEMGTAKILLTLMLALRFDAIEALLGRTDPERPTLAIPIYFLHTPPRIAEWDAGNPETLDAMIEDIEACAIPFFDKYSQLGNLFASLQSDSPQDWFSLGQEGRIETLAALLLLRREESEARTLLDNSIASSLEKGTPPERSIAARLQRLKDRFSHQKGTAWG